MRLVKSTKVPRFMRHCICPKPSELSGNRAFIGVICYKHGCVSYDKKQLREIREPVTGYLANEIDALDEALA